MELWDLVSSGLGDGAAIALGNGDRHFGAITTIVQASVGSRASVGDFNGDGRQDVAVFFNNAFETRVFLGNGDGTFTSGVTIGSVNMSRSVSQGDVNGDGITDLVGSGYRYRNICRDREWRRIIQVSSVLCCYGGRNLDQQNLIDFNGDGKLDLVSGRYAAQGISLAEGNGDGSFKTATSYYAAGSGAFDIADFNSDGALDIVTGLVNVSVILGNGTCPSRSQRLDHD